MKIKSSMVLIIVTGALLFFALNYWMSREIGQPVAPKSTVENSPSENIVVKNRALNTPAMLAPTDTQEPAVTPTATQDQQKTDHADPVYDPPSQDVILVQ